MEQLFVLKKYSAHVIIWITINYDQTYSAVLCSTPVYLSMLFTIFGEIITLIKFCDLNTAKGMNVIMKKNKIAIFSDEINGPLIASAAKKLGHDPYLFYASESKIEIQYPNIKIDPFLPIEVLGNEVEKFMGRPDAIISCVEQFSVNIAKYAEYLGISPSPVETYDIMRNKSRMKSVWKEANVSTPSSCSAKSFADVDLSSLEYPLIVKPAHGAASAGVGIVFNKEELKKQINKILRFNVSTLNVEKAVKSGFLIEDYIDGEEYSVDTIWFKGSPILNGIMSKGNPQGPSFPDRLYLTEPSLSEEIKKELLDLSHEAVKATGVISGATHTEIRMRNNKGYVIESALRPGAGGCFYQLFEKALGVSFYEALILVSLKDHTENELELLKQMSLNTSNASSTHYWYNIEYKGHGIIQSIEGEEEIIKEKFVEKVCIRKKVGDYLPAECDSYSYLGWVIGNFVEKNTFDNYYSYLRKAQSYIKVIYQNK